ncbi:MAG: SDR family oxidoreductase [candidate division Zixibacteria bacterium]|nr:SDR family oxidoreductase [candidate division Zixibacteria bacterium]
MTYSKILITGASGSLGKQLVCEHIRRDIKPVAQVRENSDTGYLDSVGLEKRICDMSARASFESLVEGVDAVIHTAAWVNFRQDRPTQFASINTIAAVNLFKAAAEAGVRRFVHVSTVVAVGACKRWGNSQTTALCENDLIDENHEFNLDHLRIPYILSKHAAETELKKAATECDTELVIVNPSIIVAPSRTGDDAGKAKKRLGRWMLPDLPNHVNLVDLRDVAPGVIAALEKGRPGERYILAGDNISVRDLLLDISSILGRLPHLVRIPRAILNTAARASVFFSKLTGRGKVSFYPDLIRLLDYDWAYSSMKARKELGYTNRSIQRTLEDLLTNNMTGSYQKPV